jgi:hypothetical protein
MLMNVRVRPELPSLVISPKCDRVAAALGYTTTTNTSFFKVTVRMTAADMKRLRTVTRKACIKQTDFLRGAILKAIFEAEVKGSV